MRAHKYSVTIPGDRRITVTLPDDVPPGRAEVIVLTRMSEPSRVAKLAGVLAGTAPSELLCTGSTVFSFRDDNLKSVDPVLEYGRAQPGRSCWRALLTLGLLLSCCGRPVGVYEPAGDGSPAGPTNPFPACSSGGLQPGAPWPMLGRCPDYNGRSPVIGPQTPELAWSKLVTTGPYPFSLNSPVIAADGTIYVGSGDFHLYALTPDGQVRWSFLSNFHVYVPPALGADGTIYFCGSDVLYAVNPDGTQKWSVDLPGLLGSGGSRCVPVIAADGTIHVVGVGELHEGRYEDWWLYAVNPDGSSRWTMHTDTLTSAPSIGRDGTLYVALLGFLTALDPDGHVLWVSEECGDPLEAWGTPSSPVIAPDGTLLVARGHIGRGSLCAYGPDGTVRWVLTFPGKGLVSFPALAPDGTIYQLVNDRSEHYGHLYAIGLDGTVRWTLEIPVESHSSPAVAEDGTVYVGEHWGHNLYAVAPDGTLRWTYALESSPEYSYPALAADGTLVVGDFNGKLYAFRP